MIGLIKEKILEDNDLFIILSNGKRIASSVDINNLEINNSIKLKVIHIVDENTKINYHFDNHLDIKIEQIFFYVANCPTITINMEIGEDTKVDFLSIIKTNDNSELKAIVNTAVNSNSYINYKTLSTLSCKSEIIEKINLDNEGACADISHIIINSSTYEQKLSIDVNHNAKNTISNLKNYGICNNNSTLNIKTIGKIKKGSTQAELKQNTKGLIIDLNSHVSTYPILLIDDFDCIANHGASIGAIDDEELYYLMSRGLTKEDSEKLIVAGLIAPFFTDIKEGKFQDYLKSWININV